MEAFMQITDIRVRKINQESRMKAIVSLTLDDALAVHDIKIIEGHEKLFVAFPSRKTPDDQFKDIVHPINAQTRDLLETAILAKYEEVMNEMPDVPPYETTYATPSEETEEPPGE